MSGLRPVAVMTDSTCDIPQAMADAEGFHMIRLMTVFPDGASFHDGELSQAEFFERMGSSGALPTTSLPPVGEFIEAYDKLLETAQQVVSIHVSNRLSGTIEAARQAAAHFGDRVTVFDSLNLSTAAGWQAIDAARAAARGASLDEVLEAAARTRARVRQIVGLDSLNNLARGGRIGAVSAFLGGLLDLKVLLTTSEEGALEPVARLRGRKAALAETLRFVQREMGGQRRGRFFVDHAMSASIAEYLRETIAREYEATELYLVEAGVTISTHTGTGWGISFVPGD